MIQPLVDPFDIEASSTRRRDTLEATLNVIRRTPRGNLSDKQYADEAGDCVDWAKDQLSGSSFPWGKVLIVGGLAVLAMTGVGLAVAALAGLAGAAVVTSTLATFGPGGMVGGLLSLGVLTGTATSLTSVGVKSALEGSSALKAQQLLPARSGVELAGAPIEGIIVTLMGMLAVVRAQTSLNFPSTEPVVRVVIANALETARSEYRQHEHLAPDSGRTKMWGRKVHLLDQAFAALNTLTGIRQVLQLETARKAIESGKRPGPWHSPRMIS
jgi:hypothetical protein